MDPGISKGIHHVDRATERLTFSKRVTIQKIRFLRGDLLARAEAFRNAKNRLYGGT